MCDAKADHTPAEHVDHRTRSRQHPPSSADTTDPRPTADPARLRSSPGGQPSPARRLRIRAWWSATASVAWMPWARTRLVNELRWQLHDLWSDWEIPARALTQLAEPGTGVLLAAKFIGEIAGIDRFTSDAQLARLAGCIPIPIGSGRTDRHRLDHSGNRRLNRVFYMLAITDPRRTPAPPSTSPSSAPTARPNAKPSATSNATSPAASTTSSATPAASRPRST